jgi:hypothetical protein
MVSSDSTASPIHSVRTQAARVLLVGMLCLLALLGVSAKSYADIGVNVPCAHGGNFTASACVNGKSGETYFAGFDDFRNVALTAAGSISTNTRHTNQVMWVYTQPDEWQWVEVGIRKGYWLPCNCVDYIAYWADINSAGTEFRHTISSTISADASDHQYEIKRDGTNHNYWDVYYDYNLVGQSTNQGSSTAYEVQHGLETTEISTNTSSGLANHSPLEYMNASGVFVHDPYEQTWVDSKCSGTTLASNCLTGYGNGSDVWYSGKG